jgi:hypothetical protein
LHNPITITNADSAIHRANPTFRHLSPMSSFTARFHLPLRLHCNRIPGVVCFASASTPIAPSPGERLVETVRSKGGTVDGISVKRWSGADGGSGFGLCMVRDCPAGTPLITLPPCLQLTYSAATDPRLLAVIHRVPAELWGGKLALQLLSHRIVAGPQSPFAAYLEALPIGFPGVPMFFSADELKTLQYPPVTSQITKRCRWLVEFAGQVLDPLRGTPQDPFEGVHVDANALGWALAAVTSRAFRIGGMDRPAALLPLIDMANHDFERANAKITGVGGGSGGVRGSTSGAALCMVATRDVKAGEPVIINYGALPNGEWVLMGVRGGAIATEDLVMNACAWNGKKEGSWLFADLVVCGMQISCCWIMDLSFRTIHTTLCSCDLIRD